MERHKTNLERKRKNLEARIADLRSEFETEEAESMKLIGIEENRLLMDTAGEKEMAVSRKAKQEKKNEN